MVTLYEFSYHCFLSYTTREEEVREVQPRVDELIERFPNYGYQVVPIFYDHYIFGSRTPSNLRAALSRAIHESAFMLILVSPGYFTSLWCIFEWSYMAETAPRRQDRIERDDTVRICRRVDAPFQFITIPPTIALAGIWKILNRGDGKFVDQFDPYIIPFDLTRNNDDSWLKCSQVALGLLADITKMYRHMP
jgi:hypothetical protein